MLAVVDGFDTQLDSNVLRPQLKFQVYDTAKTVPSTGLKARYYWFDAVPSDITGEWWTALESAGNVRPATGDYTEYSTVYSFDWGEGAPPPVQQVDNYAARWHGWFFARHSGVYNFYVDSGPQCGARIKFGTSEAAASYLSWSYDNADESGISGDPWVDDSNLTKEFYASTASLTAGQWYWIQLEFYTGSNKYGSSRAHFTVKYKEPTGATTSYNEFGEALGFADYPADTAKKVLSAGVCNYTGAFLSPTDVSGVVSYSMDKSFGEVTQAEIEVNLSPVTHLTADVASGDTVINVSGTSAFPSEGVIDINGTKATYSNKTSVTLVLDSEFGVAVDSSANSAVRLNLTSHAYDRNKHTLGSVKPYRLARIQLGLSDASGNTYWVDRMWGTILKDPEFKRTEDGIDTATIFVQSFDGLLAKDYNRNYPDYASYSGSGYYTPPVSRGPDGRTRPVCYDGWLLSDAVRDQAIKAGVDPVWTYGREHVETGSDYATSFGSYRVRGEDIYLDQKPLYGNPQNVDENEADSEYLYFFGYGTPLQESVYELCKNYGYTFAFDEDGFMRFKGMDVPAEKLYARDQAATGSVIYSSPGSFVNTVNMYSPKGIDAITSAAGEYLDFSVQGRYAEVIVTRDSDTTYLKISVDSTGVSSVYMDGSTVTATGGVIDVSMTDLTDSSWSYYQGVSANSGYNHSIIRVDLGTHDSHTVRVELPATGNKAKVGGVYVYDVLASEPILNLSTDDITELDDALLLEDTRNEVVVIGSSLGAFTDTGGNVVNPNNPIMRHVNSSAIDLNSLYNPSVNNYIGRRVPFEIYNPKILSKDRADFMATAILEKYRQLRHAPAFPVAPNPKLQVLDSVTVTDNKTGLTNTNDVLWVISYTERMSINDDETINYDMDTKLSGHKPLLSYEVKEEPELSDFSNEAFINLVIKYGGKRCAGDDLQYQGSGVFGFATGDPTWETNMWKGHYLWLNSRTQAGMNPYLIVSNTTDTLTVLLPTDSLHAEGVDQLWSISFDPFDSDRGMPLELHYDQVVNGKVSSKIINSDGGVVAEMNRSKLDDIEDWGPGKVLYWDGVDETNKNYYVSDKPWIKYYFAKMVAVVGRTATAPVITESTGNTYSQQQRFVTKIMNHGIYAEVSLLNNHDDEEVLYIGYNSTTNYVPQASGSYIYLKDDNYASWPTGDITQYRVRYYGLRPVSSLPQYSHDNQLAESFVLPIHGAVGDKLVLDSSGKRSEFTPGMAVPTFKIIAGADNYYDSPAFKKSDNDDRSVGIHIKPVNFYLKSYYPYFLYDEDLWGVFLSSGWQMPTIHYDGTDYSPSMISSATGVIPAVYLRPIPNTSPLYVASPPLEWGETSKFGPTSRAIYWNKHINKICYSNTSVSHQQENLYSNNEDVAAVEQFGKLREGLIPIDYWWLGLLPARHTPGGTTIEQDIWPKQVRAANVRRDTPLDYAHHGYHAPGKATPKPFGKVIITVKIKHYAGTDVSPDIDGDVQVFESDITDLNDFTYYFDPTLLSYGDYTVSGFSQKFVNDTDGAKITWRFRIKVDIIDKAGRRSGNCRPGFVRDEPSETVQMAEASNIIDVFWEPESGYTSSPVQRMFKQVSTPDGYKYTLTENVEGWQSS